MALNLRVEWTLNNNGQNHSKADGWKYLNWNQIIATLHKHKVEIKLNKEVCGEIFVNWDREQLIQLVKGLNIQTHTRIIQIIDNRKDIHVGLLTTTSPDVTIIITVILHISNCFLPGILVIVINNTDSITCRKVIWSIKVEETDKMPREQRTSKGMGKQVHGFFFQICGKLIYNTMLSLIDQMTFLLSHKPHFSSTIWCKGSGNKTSLDTLILDNTMFQAILFRYK